MKTINETPVRTSKSFNINNIKISEEVFLNTISEFNNIELINSSSKIKIEEVRTPIDIKYGLGEDLINEVSNKANKNYKVTINSKTNVDTIFNFDFDNQNTSLIENIDITANEETSSTIIIKYESEDIINAYHNGIIKLKAKENSNLNVVIINLLNETSNNFITIENNIEKNANVNYSSYSSNNCYVGILARRMSFRWRNS